MILTFEGIASSGKTTLIDALGRQLGKRQTVSIVDEATTLLPIIDNIQPDRAIAYLSQVLDQVERDTSDHILIDRFLLTHAARTHATVNDFAEIERRLLSIGARLVLLQMEPSAISARLQVASAIRGTGWRFGQKGSLSERSAHYEQQQLYLRHLAATTRLPSLIIDTTHEHWAVYVDKILSWTGAPRTKAA